MKYRPPSMVRAICTSLVLALSAPALQANDWPQANPDPIYPNVDHLGFLPVRNAPHFRAPSAADCHARPGLREFGGMAQIGRRPHISGKPSAEPMESKRERPDITSRDMPLLAGPETSTVGAARAVAPVPPTPAPPVIAPLPHPIPKPWPDEQVWPQPGRPSKEPVTVGMVDDNANFAEYQAFRQRTQVPHEALDIQGRRLVEVRDAKGMGIADAELRVTAPGGQSLWARTDAAGRAWIHTGALDGGHAWGYQVTARTKMGQASVIARRGDKSAIELRIDGGRIAHDRARLDLVFLIDATGSMADEIAKLKTSLLQIAADVARLPERPDVCFAYVAYRDIGDEFVWRAQDFTDDLSFFKRSLAALQAGGGGDYPEAMSEALHEVVHGLSWRGSPDFSVQRMAILLADAPPQLGPGRPSYASATQAALGKGIKFHSVAASGLDKQGEFIQRQIAQYTGGKFVFLTYAQAHRPESGPGRETVHDVQQYSVDTLDKLIVRLVRDELAALSNPRLAQKVSVDR